MITHGARFPTLSICSIAGDKKEVVITDSLLLNKKVILFAVPGAFTPTCSATHVPGFITLWPEFKAHNIDSLICLSVNDPFVMSAWARTLKAPDSLIFLADGNAELTQILGASFDGSAHGLGIRAIRFAMVIDNGIVETIFTEDTPGVCTLTSASALLEFLKPHN